MRLATRTILFATLLFPVTCAAAPAEAQESAVKSTATSTTTTAPTTSGPGATATTATASGTAAEPAQAVASEQSSDSREQPKSDATREQLNTLLQNHAPQLGTILALDPTLLSNETFLAPYPDLAAFLAAHPEVRHSPDFYLADFRYEHRGQLDGIIEPIVALFVGILIVSVLTWLVRTLIEQRRWNRLSRTQSDVHNKILDRFGTTAELLEYIKSPAGSKFLESAPIPLRAEPAEPNAPVSRVLWSVQIGVIVAAAAIGLLIASARFSDEASRALFALGVIALCIGGGFIGSGLVSVALSRRLGVWQAPAEGAE
jgi:small-conductance mechanosensitive channel